MSAADLNAHVEEAIAEKVRIKPRLPILSLDFDGVLHSYASGWQGAAIIPDPPVPGAVAFLHAAVERFRVCIFSSRSNQPGGIDTMRGWLTMFVLRDIEDRREAEHVLSLIEWPTEKPAAMIGIDDRVLTFGGQWPSMDDLASFKPWNKRPAAETEGVRDEWAFTPAIAEALRSYPWGEHYREGDDEAYWRAIVKAVRGAVPSPAQARGR